MASTPAVKGGFSTGHGCFPPTACIEGSPNVYAGGMNVARVGDRYAAHTCGNTTHPTSSRNITNGSTTVYVNGILCGRLGSDHGCGDATGNHGLSAGAKRVYIGD